jgi:hypothetical protein
MINFSDLELPTEIIDCLLGCLSEREKDVIKSRYGIFMPVLTLAEIGKKYSITRERVRQIQNNAQKKLTRSASLTKLSNFQDQVLEYINTFAGIALETNLDSYFVDVLKFASKDVPVLKLAAVIDPRFVWEHNRVNFKSHFRLSSIKFSYIKEATFKAISQLNEFKSEQSLTSLSKLLKFSSQAIKPILLLDRRICIKDSGVSLAEWRNVNPRTLFDKILYVLNKTQEPMHYSRIAELILDSNFDAKTVSVQAVHNELINNEDYVLIGRGIYAMKNWGYKEGTVSDVIASILEKKGPLHLYDLTQEVLQRRKVKPVTVQVNLNSNKSKFRRNNLGLYELV